MTLILGVVGGALLALVMQGVIRRGLLAKLRADVRALNAGDHRPLLASYAMDATLQFHVGPHRWSGRHQGRAAIERFLREFVRSGLRGQIQGLWVGGPLWALTAVVRFDDQATGEAGETLYANRTVLIVRTRWGRIVEQEDYFEDTGRIAHFESVLQAQGIEPTP
jgi:ketosteroid isomerase-like protein